LGQQEESAELVTLQELAVSNAYEFAALVAALERKRPRDRGRGVGGDHAVEAEGRKAAVSVVEPLPLDSPRHLA